MKEKELRKLETVSMRYFLQTYYDLDYDKAKEMSSLSHKSLGEVAKLYGVKITKISFKNLTKDYILTGKVILVIDYYNNIAPYIKPHTFLEDEYQTEMDERYTSYEVFDSEGEDLYDKHKGRQKTKYIKS